MGKFATRTFTSLTFCVEFSGIQSFKRPPQGLRCFPSGQAHCMAEFLHVVRTPPHCVHGFLSSGCLLMSLSQAAFTSGSLVHGAIQHQRNSSVHFLTASLVFFGSSQTKSRFVHVFESERATRKHTGRTRNR